MSENRNLPARGDSLPNIAGMTLDGPRIHISDFRGRKNVVLIFSGRQSDGRIQELISALAVGYRDIQDENAEVVFVSAGGVKQTASARHLPFPVLLDDNGEMHGAIGAIDSNGGESAAVCIADRYGEVYFAVSCSAARCPSAGDILDWLRFIEIQCPECGVSEWPHESWPAGNNEAA